MNDNLIVWPNCKIGISEYDSKSESIKLVIVGACSYTPRAIGSFLVKWDLVGQSAWVIIGTGKELWIMQSGEVLARQL